MTGKFLIDLTDPRFSIGENEDVLNFIRVKNPSAHSDVGMELLSLRDEIPGVLAYSPSYASCAYVVLHTEASRIFAIAYGQREVAFRVGASEVANAMADGGTRSEDIGPNWVAFKLWEPKQPKVSHATLLRWCALAVRTVT